MTRHSTVCIYYNLTTCKTCISMWSTNHKTTCWVDEELSIIINKLCWKNWIKNIFFNIFMNLLLCNILVMLC